MSGMLYYGESNNARIAKMTEEFYRYKDHTRLPKHPAVTGQTDQCWACGKQEEGLADKAIFNMAVAPRLPDPENPEPIKTCLLCTNDCWMNGWPLVRHHYVFAGSEDQKPEQPLPPGKVATESATAA